MGGKSSKGHGGQRSSSSGFGSASVRSPPASRYSPYAARGEQPDVKGRLQKQYSRIDDNYNSLEQKKLRLVKLPIALYVSFIDSLWGK